MYFTQILISTQGYCDGINKDSIVRPNHEEAFVFAFIASIEWINSTKGWIDAVNSSLWSEMVAYKVIYGC